MLEPVIKYLRIDIELKFGLLLSGKENGEPGEKPVR